MPLDNQMLPDFLIAELYKNTLVEIQEEAVVGTQLKPVNPLPEAVQITGDASLKYLGGNKKKVIVLLQEEGAEFINEKDLIFLSNILAACKLTIDDIGILNLINQQIVFNEVKEKMEGRYFLLFGVEPTDIKMPFVIPQFQVQHYAACTIITAPALKQLNIDNEPARLLRTKLWLSLQLCFNIKPEVKN